jgi:hypothetical protein
MSDKILAQHLSRKAVLYVRQSSAHQVSHNLESQKLQYAMRQRLQMLGWEEIEVIDNGSWTFGGWRNASGRFRENGSRRLPRQGRRGGSSRGVAFRSQQS